MKEKIATVAMAGVLHYGLRSFAAKAAACIAVCGLLFLSMYRYQKNLNIPFRNSLSGFVCFLFFFQLIQSMAATHGYLIRLFRQKGEWK